MKSALDKFMPKRLLHIRQENLLSQQQMADLLNVSKPYYNRIENGTRAISDLQIKIIAQYFAIDEEELSSLNLADKLDGLLGKASEQVANRAMKLLNDRIK